MVRAKHLSFYDASDYQIQKSLDQTLLSLQKSGFKINNVTSSITAHIAGYTGHKDVIYTIMYEDKGAV